MEGLDLFIPAVDDQSSSSESEVDVTSDEDWDKGSKKGAEPIEETEGVDRDFEIEKVRNLVCVCVDLSACSKRRLTLFFAFGLSLPKNSFPKSSGKCPYM